MIRIESRHVMEKVFSEYLNDVEYTTVEITLPTNQTYDGFLIELKKEFPNSCKEDTSLFDFLAYERYNNGSRITFRIVLKVSISELSSEDHRIYIDLLRVKDDFENRNSIKYIPTLDLFDGDPNGYAIVNLENFTRFEDLHWKVRELIGFGYSNCTNMDAMLEEMVDINRYPKSVKILFVGIPKMKKNNISVLVTIFAAQQMLKKSRRIEFISSQQ